MTVELLLSALGIFALRLIDVSLGTLRIQFLVQGRRRLAGATAFFESLVWTIAAVLVLGELDEPLKLVGYAGGYACGTMLGSLIEGRIALGDRLVRVVSALESPQVADALQNSGYPVTVVNGEGAYGQVRVSFSVIPRRKVDEVLQLIKTVNPAAFVTVEEARLPGGYPFPAAATRRATALRK